MTHEGNSLKLGWGEKITIAIFAIGIIYTAGQNVLQTKINTENIADLNTKVDTLLSRTPQVFSSVEAQQHKSIAPSPQSRAPAMATSSGSVSISNFAHQYVPQ